MDYLKENDIFGSSDINLHATLRYYGYSTEAINKSDPSKAIFFVKRDAGLDGFIQQYFAHELRVEPLAFAAIIKELKTRLYHA
ncbi:MAG: hypothetical protein UW15_C0018G0002 [Parcubacteria group bacterium GW2011_GWC1_44_10]|uniref:DUF5659 domain-containing protein n=1 Tax=Candidatus Giovannonibacteria bacterium GW2011_GWA1_44_25 TaxID=1618645 RepID=A0A0G1IJJ9_9BACT|nr:MAG: hypothetical protein US07_C0005G0012 [Candidatus Levybacteria bacterium GW2011_GWB1_36_18]KKT29089.1 MAG: hypothetical protein UW15_C0018G0002 [Parcubacteria group bacterium GW2011_GWC1_44_10]KKT59340.1 MAG: hypothetical protein UW53_C0015G0023 [Candidatus Giovannonibacteria bacterium GW2011_GWA1_44_25]